MRPIRWGILGTGMVARQFAIGLSSLPDAQLVAVGSRSEETALAFGAQFAIPHRHASYAALAHDPDVDVVYIATPHTYHKVNSLLCLHAGKAVLCEKPFTINAAEAKEVIAVAREKKLFLMEAIGMRFIPALVKVRELLAAGTIGEVRILKADFGIRANFNPQSRLFDPALGGGALLDLGIYPISLGYIIFGKPTQIISLSYLGKTGVDEQSAILLGYADGQLALLSSAISTNIPQEVLIIGTHGQIRIHAPFPFPTRLTLTLFPESYTDYQHQPASLRFQLKRRVIAFGKRSQLIQYLNTRYWNLAQWVLHGVRNKVFYLPLTGNGYNYEAAEVIRCLQTGKIESEVMPLDETLAIMGILDQIRQQWGLKYPHE